ncbi:MAG: transcription termination/antitermination protein NusG [Isosphaeraceae bacterium]
MTDPLDNPAEPIEEPEDATTGSAEAAAPEDSSPAAEPVAEETPDGGQPPSRRTPRRRKAAEVEAAEEAPLEAGSELEPEVAPAAEQSGSAEADDEEPQPDLVWYVLKVQSSREDTIRDALKRRVKIQNLGRYFGKDDRGEPRIVVPTEKITEIRNNKKRIVERKTYPGYIMVQMELNEKTWFLVRETPGVGDFVGAHGTPTKMTEVEVNQMLHQEEEKTTVETPKVRIDVERGDRVKIKDGPFENFEGTVEEVIEGRGLVKVMLIIFNRPTPVDLEYWQLERI